VVFDLIITINFIIISIFLFMINKKFKQIVIKWKINQQ